MVLADLQAMASGLGISGTARMRKGQLIAAIQTAQGGGAPPEDRPARAERDRDADRDADRGAYRDEPRDDVRGDDAPERARQNERQGERQGNRNQGQQHNRNQGNGQGGQGNRNQGGQNQGGQNQGGAEQGGQNQSDDDGDEGAGDHTGAGRRNRYRDRRNRNRNRNRDGLPVDHGDPIIGDDDVLVPVAGIVHLLDNYAFVRTSGYLAGPNDVYLSMSQVRRHGVRAGDAVTGLVRQPQEGERREKYNPLVRLDTINGLDPEEAKKRPEFAKLVPLYPQERLRLETEPQILTTRVIDLVAPIGKGQRGLIVSPPKAGKTMVLQAIANAITRNNPEVHLMVVLVDERPEEVTDMQRTVRGEVIHSTFDRPAQEHTALAELAVERAKRLVEQGHDVVMLLDSITRLGRAYNLAAPSSSRILAGGVATTAIYPPKKF
ncbi:MAG TPA: transcription termination factor Rho, partial [Mycobacteriales bacterium]|nr:transcription termination factor Rho [Mycobacteriales bacterium]